MCNLTRFLFKMCIKCVYKKKFLKDSNKHSSSKQNTHTHTHAPNEIITLINKALSRTNLHISYE